MYRYKVRYRYDKPHGIISGMQTLEFELDRDLPKDGFGEWRRVCANIIQSRTGISTHLIRTEDDSNFTCTSLGRVSNSTSESTSDSRSNVSQTPRSSNSIYTEDGYYDNTVEYEEHVRNQEELERQYIIRKRRYLMDKREKELRLEQEELEIYKIDQANREAYYKEFGEEVDETEGIPCDSNGNPIYDDSEHNHSQSMIPSFRESLSNMKKEFISSFKKIFKF